MNNDSLIFDGAIGSILLNNNYEGCFPKLNIENPKIIEKIHKKYLKAGANIIKTNTFNADINSLKECKLLNKIKEINIEGVRIAQNAIKNLANNKTQRYIAGNIGPSVKRSYEVNNKNFIESAYIQSSEMLKTGIDFILLETMISLKEIELLLLGIEKAFSELNKKKEIIVSITPNENGDLLIDGTLLELEKIKMIKYIGLNCGNGFNSFYMGMSKCKKIDYLAPNLDFPVKINNKLIYNKNKETFYNEIAKLTENRNVKFIGGCCGTTPEYIEYLRFNILNRF
jgi:methionine synthase I (cobalamin-dependent)